MLNIEYNIKYLVRMTIIKQHTFCLKTDASYLFQNGSNYTNHHKNKWVIIVYNVLLVTRVR